MRESRGGKWTVSRHKSSRTVASTILWAWGGLRVVARGLREHAHASDLQGTLDSLSLSLSRSLSLSHQQSAVEDLQ